MFKYFFFLFLCLYIQQLGFSQVTADEIMVLHTVNTTADMNAIVNPTKGSFIFNDEDKNVYVFDGTSWISNSTETPYITNTVSEKVSINQTKTLSFKGVHFTPTTSLSIPGFGGTINSVNVVSPTLIEVNVTADAVQASYDVVVTNNGLSNTAWSGNGVDVFEVGAVDGQTQLTAGLSCKTILDDGLSVGDGTYWINPDGGSTSNAFQVYCDMTTDGGGWTRIDYAADLPHTNHFGNTFDALRWLPSDFSLTLTDTQINNIRAISSEGKQTYRGTCDGVIHYLYQAANYGYAFGFRFHDGSETVSQNQSYAPDNISVVADGCRTNNNASTDTVFEILDKRVPVINVQSRDNGAASEQFGSPLTANPAWLR